jgi:hypothetical protein
MEDSDRKALDMCLIRNTNTPAIMSNVAAVCHI